MHSISLLLAPLWGASVSANNPVVKALIGTSGAPGIVIIAHAVLNGAILVRCMEEAYSWMIRGHADHGRNLVNLMAGGFVIQKAPEIVGIITGVTIPQLF